MRDQTLTNLEMYRKPQICGDRIPCLVVIHGGSPGDVFKLEKSSVLIGRGAQVDLYLGEEGISRHHARIDVHENSYTLTDLGSTNGTWVNGFGVEQVTLHEGDKIFIGQVLFRFSFLDSWDVNYQESLKKMNRKDPVTQLPHREFFLEILEREFGFALRTRQPMSCLLLKVDRLIQIQEVYGMGAGDEVLRTLAKSFSEGLRSYDVFARYGEDQLAILLRGTALENAQVFAHRIQEKALQLMVEYDEKTIPVSLSIGISTLNPDDSPSQQDLLKEAEMYMNVASQKKGNQVCSVRSSPSLEISEI